MLPIDGAYPAMVSNVRLRDFQSSMFGGDAKPRGVVADVCQIVTSCAASRYGSGRSSVASTSAKIALLAPMPIASVITATSVKTGALRNCRSANTTSPLNSSSHNAMPNSRSRFRPSSAMVRLTRATSPMRRVAVSRARAGSMPPSISSRVRISR